MHYQQILFVLAGMFGAVSTGAATWFAVDALPIWADIVLIVGWLTGFLVTAMAVAAVAFQGKF